MVENLDYEIQFKIFNKLGIKRTFTSSKVSDYERLSKLLKEYDIVCETIHAPFDHINDMWGDDVGFCWDNGHQYCRGENIDYMGMFSDKLIALHIHDNRCGLDTDDHLLPFDGNIDFDVVAKAIADSGYEGTLMLEVFKNASKGDEKIYERLTDEEYYERAVASAKKLSDMVESYK